MAILASRSPRCLSIFRRWMIQSDELSLSEILDSPLLADAFEEDNVDFGIAVRMSSLRRSLCGR